MDIRSAQNLAWENKAAKRFGTTDVPLGEELADVAIYLLGPPDGALAKSPDEPG